MKLTAKLLLSITLVTVVIILALTNFFIENQRKVLLEQAHIQAKTLFNMIVITRQWVAENRDEVAPVPAVVTKELSKYAENMSDLRFHITSRKLINPENAPDAFEVRSLEKFGHGAKEYSETVSTADGKFYRYMAPLYINSACLECHDYQGYKVGDLRGGISVTIPLDAMEKSLAKNSRNYEILGFAAFLGIVVTIILLLRFTVLRNIGMLTQAAASYKTGDFTKKIEVKTNDEIQELAEAFDVMRVSILENEDNLKNQLEMVTDKYKTVMHELRGRNEELKSINTFKSDILDSLAHELRTPLTKIISYSELLSSSGDNCGQEVREKSLATIAKSARLLNLLFNEIIILSRLDSNQYPYHFIPVKLKQMVSDVLAEYDKDIADKRLAVSVDMDDDATICVDGESFRHIISNLVSNAVKFNREDGFVTLRLYEDGDCNVVECSDGGVGIPLEEQDKITKRFYRGSNVKREFSGTGLGLSIIARTVEGHNGRLEIVSEDGKGATFRVFIPKTLRCSGVSEEDQY